MERDKMREKREGGIPPFSFSAASVYHPCEAEYPEQYYQQSADHDERRQAWVPLPVSRDRVDDRPDAQYERQQRQNYAYEHDSVILLLSFSLSPSLFPYVGMAHSHQFPSSSHQSLPLPFPPLGRCQLIHLHTAGTTGIATIHIISIINPMVSPSLLHKIGSE